MTKITSDKTGSALRWPQRLRLQLRAPRAAGLPHQTLSKQESLQHMHTAQRESSGCGWRRLGSLPRRHRRIYSKRRTTHGPRMQPQPQPQHTTAPCGAFTDLQPAELLDPNPPSIYRSAIHARMHTHTALTHARARLCTRPPIHTYKLASCAVD